jgi:hypothetical protein
VVATDELDLSVILPVRTHNDLLFGNGSRTTATDWELIERFLLASRLAGASANDVRTELSRSRSPGTAVPEATYTSYLFETSPWGTTGEQRRVRPDRLDEIMRSFVSMDPSAELSHYKVDYLWTEAGRQPALLQGWSWMKMFSNADGNLWRLVLTGKTVAQPGSR